MRYRIVPTPKALRDYVSRLEENVGTQKIIGVCPLCKERPKLVYTEDPDGLRWHHECRLVPSWFGTMMEWVGIRKRMQKGMSFEAAVGNIKFTRKFLLDEDERRLEKEEKEKLTKPKP